MGKETKEKDISLDKGWMMTTEYRFQDSIDKFLIWLIEKRAIETGFISKILREEYERYFEERKKG